MLALLGVTFGVVIVVAISICILRAFDRSIGRTLPCPNCNKYILRGAKRCPCCDIKIRWRGN